MGAGGTQTDDILQLLWLIIGLGFLTAFVVVLARHRKAGGADSQARWIRLVERMGPLGAAGVGLFLVNWEMEIPALAVILKSRVPTGTALAALVVFTAVAVSTSVAPFLIYLAAPDSVSSALDKLRDIMTKARGDKPSSGLVRAGGLIVRCRGLRERGPWRDRRVSRR